MEEWQVQKWTVRKENSTKRKGVEGTAVDSKEGEQYKT